MTKEERQKEIVKVQQSKGQLLASIEKVEKYLPLEDFKDYCDAIYTAVAYQDIICLLINCNNEQLEDESFKNKTMKDLYEENIISEDFYKSLSD